MRGLFVARSGMVRRRSGPQGAWRSMALAGLAGVLHTASFSPTEWWWLQIAALALLVVALNRATPWRAFGLGMMFGFAWLASGLWWLYISMHRYGGLHPAIAASAVALLAAGLSVYLGAAMAAYARWRRGWAGSDAWLFAACWLLAELARGSWLTGFPWLASGHAHTAGPLAALAPWIGVYGIGALSAVLAAALALWATDLPSARLPAAAWALALAGLVAAAQALPRDFTRPTGMLSVSLIQPNVSQDLKFEPARIAGNFERLARAMESARGALVVTPESVVPIPLSALEPGQWQRLQRAVAQPGRAALVGIFVGDESSGYVNSMVGLTATSDGREPSGYRYGKRHLLPFGEFIPPGFQWFVRLMNIPLDDQARGSHGQPMTLGAQRLRPLICYEDLFGEEMAASAVGPGAATIFVNASNLAWFGTWMIQDQHLQFSRMRAMEFQRPFVRATNTGATTVIDHQGTVTHRLPPDVAATLDASVQGRLGDTPYARWLAAAGLWPLWALGLAVLGLAAAWRR